MIKRIKSTLDPRFWPRYCEVLTLKSGIDQHTSRSIAPMHLRHETSGFWKTLPLDKVGTDKHGMEVHGKSWVTKELSWNEKSTESDTSPISVISNPPSQNVGYIYIMRSLAHGRHVYKIGFTDRNPEDRSDDLSATSGQPDYFIVVQSWEVFDAHRVEQAIHRQLSQFRLNPRREFFKVKFERARETIEEIIKTMKASCPNTESGTECMVDDRRD
jgi:hypothetical protein